jgi:hypothetical protein
MGKLNLDNLSLDKVKITVVENGDKVDMKIVGDIDMENPGESLKPFFNKLHDGLVAGTFAQINVDFQNLAFMNSSGIKELVQWIMKVNGATHKYKIVLTYSSAITWQGSSLPVLHKLHPEIVSVQAV